MRGWPPPRRAASSGGRKPSYTAHQAKTARSLHAQGELNAEEIGRVIGVSRATVYRMLKTDAA